MGIDSVFAKNNNHNKLILEINNVPRTFTFREGGQLEDPRDIKAQAGGGHTVENLFEEWSCEGKVTITLDMMQYLIESYESQTLNLTNSAIHKAYTSQGKLLQTTSFGHVMLKKKPMIIIENMGEEALVTLSFSLNNYNETRIEKVQ